MARRLPPAARFAIAIEAGESDVSLDASTYIIRHMFQRLSFGSLWRHPCWRETPSRRIAHNDRQSISTIRLTTALAVWIYALFGASNLNTNVQFLHRGVIPSKSGIGEHFHNRCEEMF